MPVSTRRLAPADMPLLLGIDKGVFDDPIDEASAKAFLEDPNHFLVIASLDNKGPVVGFASATRLLHPDKTAFELFINEIGVAPDHRRKGVGKALMKTLREEARKANCRVAWLAVDEDNDTALAFYKSVGGKPPEKQFHVDFDLADEG